MNKDTEGWNSIFLVLMDTDENKSSGGSKSVRKKKKKNTDEVCWIELTPSLFFNFPFHFSRVGKISVLTSVTKNCFFPFYSPEPTFSATCSGRNCDLNSYQQCHIKTKGERIQKRKEGNSSLTNNSNDSSLKPPKFFLQRKCQSC